MVVRVDTTNLTRGLDFTISVHTMVEPNVSLYAFNTSTHTYEALIHTMSQEGIFFKATAKAPYFDGFLLAKINSKSMIVKKIGHPTPHFVIGYKENYTVPYKLFSESGVVLRSGNLINIIDGFYYCEILHDATIMETLKKKFIIKDNFTKLNFDVNLGESVLNDIVLTDYVFDVTLGDATLNHINLESVTLDATLTDAEITEY